MRSRLASKGRRAKLSFRFVSRVEKKRLLFGLWLSLVERAVRVGEVQGSNPCSPTLALLTPRVIITRDPEFPVRRNQESF